MATHSEGTTVETPRNMTRFQTKKAIKNALKAVFDGSLAAVLIYGGYVTTQAGAGGAAGTMILFGIIMLGFTIASLMDTHKWIQYARE